MSSDNRNRDGGEVKVYPQSILYLNYKVSFQLFCNPHLQLAQLVPIYRDWQIRTFIT